MGAPLALPPTPTRTQAKASVRCERRGRSITDAGVQSASHVGVSDEFASSRGSGTRRSPIEGPGMREHHLWLRVSRSRDRPGPLSTATGTAGLRCDTWPSHRGRQARPTPRSSSTGTTICCRADTAPARLPRPYMPRGGFAQTRGSVSLFGQPGGVETLGAVEVPGAANGLALSEGVDVARSISRGIPLAAP